MAKYKWDNLILFAEQIAAASQLGLPLDQTIRQMSAEALEPDWKKAQESVAELHSLGSPLSEAMESNAAYFPAMISRLVRVGEEGRVLPRMLQSLSHYLQSARETQHRLQRCLVYPFLVWCVLCLEIGVMFIFWFPKFTEMSMGLGFNFPTFTSLFVNLGPAVFVIGMGMVFYLAWLIIGLLSARIEAQSKFAQWVERILPRIPFLGILSRHAKTAQLCEVLGVLMEGGHSGRDSIVLAKGMVDSPAMTMALDEVETAILAGSEFQPTDQRTLIPATTLWMIAQSNGKGELGQTLRSIASLHQRQLDVVSHIIREIMEPLLIVLVAVLGGLAIVGFYLPIFNIPAGFLGSLGVF